MTFSMNWDHRYRENTHMSIWPWSDVVSLVHRHCKPVIAAGNGQVYEVGCGAGANIPLFCSLGMSYHGSDGSPTIVHALQRQYPEFSSTIRVADFTRENPFDTAFDIVLDRGSLTHNDARSIRSALGIVFDALKPGGLFISVDLFSVNHSDFSRGKAAADDYTRTGYVAGSFADVGSVHFFDEPRLRDLFAAFEIVALTEKLVRNYEPADSHVLASWNVVARKPAGR